jgi:hypothetical protein
MAMRYLPILAILFGAAVQPLTASVTYTTLDGEVNLIAGLSNLTTTTAIGTTNQSVGISYITDSSWSTGIENLGGLSSNVPNNGKLAGTFGGGTFFGTSNGIILIGAVGNFWGSWTIRLLLSDDTYSSASSFSSDNLVQNSAAMTAPDSVFFANFSGFVPAGTNFSPGSLASFYQELDITAFDTNNIGFKGIELSNMGDPFPDLTYIGVTGSVPEPTTSLLSVLGATMLLRRRRK